MRKNKSKEQIADKFVSMLMEEVLKESKEKLKDFLLENPTEIRTAIRDAGGYEEWIEYFMAGINGMEQQKVGLEKTISEHDQFVEKRKKELEDAKKRLEKMKQEVVKLEKYVAETKQYNHQLKHEKETMEEDIKNIKKILVRSEQISLVHSSAILSSIIEYQLSIMVVTECDNPKLEIFRPDIIVQANQLEKLIFKMPYNFENGYSPEQQESIINYCELVANTLMSVEDSSKVKLLYNNPDIKKILTMNGIEA